ncbi:MAG: pyridoxal-phosphate dependent enzyme [Psychrobium sp.]|nr:pyridoxal-phosphate dependent enzyme [Psychrobium sp.]
MEIYQDSVLESKTAIKETYFQYRLKQREALLGLSENVRVALTRKELYTRLEKGIGHTPIQKISLPNNNVLIQKFETSNPTETHYDRCYIRLIKLLEENGSISPGDILLETTSGSAGVSFAWICKLLGYEAIVFMPSFVPEPRILEVSNLASAVHLNENKEEYLLACARDMVNYYRSNKKEATSQGKKIYMPNHSQHDYTPETFSTIADELKQDLGELNVDYFIGGIGNGSTLLGIGQRFKEIYPEAKVLAFEPMTACPYYLRHQKKWGKYAPILIADSDIPEKFSFHQMPGTGSFGNVDFPFINKAIATGVIDDILPVPDAKIIANATYNDDLSQQDKQGNTSIVARYIAEELAKGISGKIIFTLVYDKADRYGKPRYLK